MTLIQRIEFWGERHHPAWMDIVRIALGLFLIAKGVQFINNYNVLMDLMPGWMSFSSFMTILVGHYVVGAHILGGVLITLGLLTRAACLMQIPILLGAVFFAGQSGNVLHPFSNLLLAVVVLLLLIYFLIASNGPWSLDAIHAGEEEKKK
ncbi:DoxX family protein [Niabella pedocola]|uniref:DoxX family protein n=1 Tax=Niabella pedocola TaxID=1752077 RepID=A0ABS8PYC5_9BACT|nr:DoxX family protein [Niabella pedocola]MCD2425333.1 DoxX family protein [Niabella pedocola]